MGAREPADTRRDMTDALSPLALDALGEVSNIGAGNAANALSQLLGTPVDLDVPAAQLAALSRATELIGEPESEVVGILTGVHGGLDATVLLLFSLDAADRLLGHLGLDRSDVLGTSAMQEIGNILTSSYVMAIGQLTGLTLEPHPPLSATNMLGALVDGVLALAAVESETVLLLTTTMRVAGVAADFSFLFVPEQRCVAGLLGTLGIAS
jgi:chemotaxis protein CheC